MIIHFERSGVKIYMSLVSPVNNEVIYHEDVTDKILPVASEYLELLNKGSERCEQKRTQRPFCN